jgi:hypothetical protein
VYVRIVIARGLIVEHCRGGSQRYASWLQSMFFGVSAFASLTSAYFGGFLLDYTSKQTLMALSAIFPLSVALRTFVLLSRLFPLLLTDWC